MPQSLASPVKNIEDLLHRMTDRIRQSLELPEILEATVDEMRQFLKTDRVKVYRFHSDGSGEVVAESIKAQRLPSLLGQRFPADDIPEQAREMFLQARQRSIVNVAKQEIGLSPLLDEPDSDQNQALLTANLSFRQVDPCHVEYLTAMGVQSSLVVPILHRHRLWGLLVAHHSVARRFGHKELEIVQLVADQVAMAISHASLLHLTRLQGQHEAVINQVVSRLYSTAQDPLKNALDQMINDLQCIGGRLYIPAEGKGGQISSHREQIITSGVQLEMSELGTASPSEKARSAAITPLERLPNWQTWLKRQALNQPIANLWVISDIQSANVPRAIASLLAAKNIRSLLIAKLIHQNRFVGYLSLFRQARDSETIWAGRLVKDARQQRPRQSFEAWREIKKNQAHTWKSRESGLAQDLADRFAAAIYQMHLYERIQALNADLEQRVLQRTAALKQLNENLKQEIVERERALKELQEARDALRRLSHQNELILNSAGEGIYGIDPKGKVVFVNPAAVKMLGYEKENLIGQFMHDLLKHSKPEGLPYVWEQSPVCKTLKYGKTYHVTGDLFERQDSYSFPAEYVSTSIQEKGKIIGAVVIFKDITERQMIESMKDEFIAVVSHELRTPLTSIRAALGLLAQEKLEISAAKRQRMIEIAFSNTNRLVRLVSDILDVEKIKLGKIRLNKKNCNLADIMAQAADEMHAMAEKHGIHLAVSSLSMQLYADPDKMIQTLTNLLSNAIKFSPNGSTVSMTAEEIGAHGLANKDFSDRSKEAIQRILEALEEDLKMLLIQVKDQGKGIPENKLEAIFDQFEQLQASDAEHQGGTGLGLAICRSIVEQHKGVIWAESTLGLGSTFAFVLPVFTETS
jgi:PAS domain S-box-containing protein